MNLEIDSIEYSMGQFHIVLNKCENRRLETFLTETQGDIRNYEITLKKAEKKRSMDANEYMWALCREIAKKLSVKGDNPIVYTDKDIYRAAIKEVGVWFFMLLQNKAVDSFINHHLTKEDGTKYVGRFVENMGESKSNPGNTVLKCYYGSSDYNQEEMSRVIDYLVMEANGLGIPTATRRDTV